MRIDKPNGISHIRLRANVKLVLRQGDKVLHRESGHNLVMTNGFKLIADLVDPNGSVAEPEYAALGSGNTPADSGDTGLDSEHSGSRTAASNTMTGLSHVGLLYFVFTITATDTWVVNEIGLFNDPSSGVLFARFLTQGFTMVSGNELQIIWEFAFGHGEDIE